MYLQYVSDILGENYLLLFFERGIYSSLLPIPFLPFPSQFHTCGKQITKGKGEESLDHCPQQVLVDSDDE